VENFKLLTERKGKQAGQILAMVVKLVDETDLPEPEPVREKIGPLCRSAIELCKNADFQQYVAAEYAVIKRAGSFEHTPERDAKETILSLCGVDSRKELDEYPDAAKKLSFLMADYRAWIAQNRGQK